MLNCTRPGIRTNRPEPGCGYPAKAVAQRQNGTVAAEKSTPQATMAEASGGARRALDASAAAVIIGGMADSRTATSRIGEPTPATRAIASAAAGSTISFPARPNANGQRYSGTSLNFSCKPTASVTSGSSMSANACASASSQSGNHALPSNNAPTSATNGGKVTIRRAIVAALGAGPSPYQASTS